MKGREGRKRKRYGIDKGVGGKKRKRRNEMTEVCIKKETKGIVMKE